MERTALRRCSLTHLMLSEEFFVKSKTNETKSFLGLLWLNVSKRAVNGRYHQTAQANPKTNVSSYDRKGIRMADVWVNDPTRFALDVLAEIGMPRTRDGKRLSLDRIDNDGDYVPGNLRWATAMEQVLNSDQRNVQVY